MTTFERELREDQASEAKPCGSVVSAPGRLNHWEEQLAAWRAFLPSLGGWEVFVTGTFRHKSGIATAAKCFERFMRTECPSVSYFYAVELHPGGHGAHVHAMLADCRRVYRKRVWRAWFTAYGRNRIEPIRKPEGVHAYCAKYVTKAALWWNWHLSPAGRARYQVLLYNGLVVGLEELKGKGEACYGQALPDAA